LPLCVPPNRGERSTRMHLTMFWPVVTQRLPLKPLGIATLVHF